MKLNNSNFRKTNNLIVVFCLQETYWSSWPAHSSCISFLPRCWRPKRLSITVDGRQLLTNTGIQAPVSTNSTLSQGKTVVVNKYSYWKKKLTENLKNRVGFPNSGSKLSENPKIEKLNCWFPLTGPVYHAGRLVCPMLFFCKHLTLVVNK